MVGAPLTAALAGIAMSTALASPGFAQVEYDSAGVTVVENAPAGDSTLGWTVGPHPRVEIGGAVDDARYQLYRVVDAARMFDGRIVRAPTSCGSTMETGRTFLRSGAKGEGRVSSG